MPRAQKSKLCAHQKRHHYRSQAHGLKDVQPATAEEEEAISSYSPEGSDGPSTSGAAVTLPKHSSITATPSAATVVSCQITGGHASSLGKKKQSSSRASTATIARPVDDLLAKKASILLQYILHKYQMKEPIRRAGMLKFVQKSFREKFPEILEQASMILYLIHGLELKEVRPNSHSYTLVCIADDTGNGSVSSAWRFPTRGILMPLLGLIYLRHGRASEEEIWKILNSWSIYEGISHFLFGEPRKLITQDLVKEKYLEYRQVPGSDPPRFEFLWGSRAHAETNNMKVLELFSKINATVPIYLPCNYEEALRDAEARARATASNMVGTTSKSSGDSRATCSHRSHSE